MKNILGYFGHPLLKIPLLAGLATGVLCFLYFLGLYALGVPALGNVRVLDFGIHIIMMVATVWYYRKYVGHGQLHLWEGLTIGYVLNTVAALITGWLVYFFVTQVDPGVFAEYVVNSKKLLLEGKKQITDQFGPETFAQQWAKVVNMQPGVLLPDELTKKTALAVLPVLVISLIFRKQDYSIMQ
jgi:amino acid transporter